MKKTTLVFVFLSILFFGCEDSDSSSETRYDISVDNKSYIISSYKIFERIDVNHDGVFSFDLFNEGSFEGGTLCTPGTAIISFNPETQKTQYAGAVGFSLHVDNQNGNLFQSVKCGISDGIAPTYRQENNQIEIIRPSSDHVLYTGTISNDGESITFQVPLSQSGLGFGNYILTEEDEIIQYWDDVILTFTRRE